MSRVIHLRSPYFVKASAIDGKTLESAQLDLYIWQGSLDDQPTTPNFSLQKSTEDSDKNYVVFEISELCRDEINYTFDGKTRKTEPVYINTELTMTNDDGTTVTNSDLVYGVDGYRDFKDGLQVTENLFASPAVVDTEDEDDFISVTIEDSLSGTSDREYESGESISIEATYQPSNATLQWFLDDSEISGATSATYTTTADANTEGSYFCRAYLNEGLTDETYSDSNTIDYTLATCKPIYFSPSGQGSNYINFGNAKGSERDITTAYSTDCYNALTTDDITFGRGDSSPFMLDPDDGLTTTGSGVQKSVTIKVITRHKNLTSNQRDNMYVKFFNKTTNRSETHTIKLQQLHASGALHFARLDKYELNSLGGTIKLTVSGDVGTKFDLRIVPLVDDTDGDGKITDEADYNWIQQNALSALSGTIEEDGDTEFDITIGNNTLAVQREMYVIAILSGQKECNGSNCAATPTFTQDVLLPYAYFQNQDITFDDNGVNDETFTYYSNVKTEMRITKGSDAFKLILPELSDPGPPKVVFEPEMETNVLYYTATPSAGRTITVRSLKNNGRLREGTISVKPEGAVGWTDTLSLSQPGSDDFLIWQEWSKPAGNRTGITTLNVGSTKSPNELIGWWVEVNSSVDWTITAPDNVSFDSLGNYGVDKSGKAGNHLISIWFEEDLPDATDVDVDLVLTSDDPDYTQSTTLTITRQGDITESSDGPVPGDPVIYKCSRTDVLSDWTIDTSTTYTPDDLKATGPLDGWAFKATASDDDAGDFEYQWYFKPLYSNIGVRLYNSDNSDAPAIIYTLDEDNDTYCMTTPIPITEWRTYFAVTNKSTGLGQYSDLLKYSFAAAEGTDWVTKVEWADKYIYNAYGARRTLQPSIDAITKQTIYNLPQNAGRLYFTVENTADSMEWNTWISALDNELEVDFDDASESNEEGTFLYGLSGDATVSADITENTNAFGTKGINVTFTTDETNYIQAYVFKFLQAKDDLVLNVGGGGTVTVASNSNSNNASTEQNNSAEPVGQQITHEEIIEQVTELADNLGLNNNNGNEVDETIYTEEEVVEVQEEQNVVANQNIAEVFEDLQNLQNLLDAVNEEKLEELNDSDEDFGLADIVEDNTTTTTSNTNTPTPNSNPVVVKPKPTLPNDFNKNLKDLF